MYMRLDRCLRPRSNPLISVGTIDGFATSPIQSDGRQFRIVTPPIVANPSQYLSEGSSSGAFPSENRDDSDPTPVTVPRAGCVETTTVEERADRSAVPTLISSDIFISVGSGVCRCTHQAIRCDSVPHPCRHSLREMFRIEGGSGVPCRSGGDIGLSHFGLQECARLDRCHKWPQRLATTDGQLFWLHLLPR
jgi:hypothetical protein